MSLCVQVCVGKAVKIRSMHDISAERSCKASLVISRDIPIQPGLKAGLRVRNQSVKYSTNTFWSFGGGSGGGLHTPQNVILTSVAQRYPLTREERDINTK